ncbi:2-isopropylmalate synthase [Pelagophyceae sp. CCMP2097]|nr:2-isopropylmalate synthase [Pelagophyceae sp. CCMP2097]
MARKQRASIHLGCRRGHPRTQGISASCEDKLQISRRLADLGVDHIEAGWPGSNPKDVEFFRRAATELDADARSRLVAFGSTRRKDCDAADDKQLQALVDSGCTACIVAKASSWQATAILGVTVEENLAMISSSVSWLVSQRVRVMVDLEHFFDAYGKDFDTGQEKYCLQCASAALKAGADVVVLCDTNGGAMPWDVEAIVRDVSQKFPCAVVGIHAHDDSGLAVANSAAAVRGGAALVQGTMNGVGERCGNANLCTLSPTLVLKMGLETGVVLSKLTAASRFVDEILNRAPNKHAPYVGLSAFAHKGGLHAAAVHKDGAAYEHEPPSLVGNSRRVLVSELSGRANIWAAIEVSGLVANAQAVPLWKDRAAAILQRVKRLEALGYSFEGADASVHLLLLRSSAAYCAPFRVHDYSVTLADDRIDGMRSMAEATPTKVATARATIKLSAAGEEPRLDVAEGTGPVDALFDALKKALKGPYGSAVSKVEISDYKVRILDPTAASRAATRVLISFRDIGTEKAWTTVAVDRNVVSASANALVDGFEYAVIEHADFCALCDSSFESEAWAADALEASA